jgi:hypothetical protein
VRSDQTIDRLIEWFKVLHRDIPYRPAVRVLILVAWQSSNRLDLSPWHFGRKRGAIGGDVSAGSGEMISSPRPTARGVAIRGIRCDHVIPPQLPSIAIR